MDSPQNLYQSEIRSPRCNEAFMECTSPVFYVQVSLKRGDALCPVVRCEFSCWFQVLSGCRCTVQSSTLTLA